MSNNHPAILVVEDEDAIRLTLRDYLEGEGYQVHVASDGVGAIKHLLDHRVDLIVTDYRMEVLGGEYWVRFLRRFCSDLPIVVTSGFLQPDFEVPFEVVYKPYDYGDLEQLIAATLKTRNEGQSSE